MRKNNKYGQLTAIKFDHKNKWGVPYWLFYCDCGIKKVVNSKNVERGLTKSCGCIRKKKFIERITKHGMTETRIYECWTNMKTRCLNKNCKEFKYYGARGIKICERWLNSFENFFEDMGNMPKNKTLDRRDNDKNYEPDNCKWSTMKEQCKNRRHKGSCFLYN